jgi:hypothetical protein
MLAVALIPVDEVEGGLRVELSLIPGTPASCYDSPIKPTHQNRVGVTAWLLTDHHAKAV